VLCRVGFRAQPELVEELVQEVYCRLLEDGAARLRRCRGGTEPELIAFMGIIAERVVLDHRRLAAARKRTGLATVRLGRLGRRGRRTVERLPDPGPTPEEAALRRERRRLLVDCCLNLRGLGPARRNAWVLRLAVQGYSSREISDAAGGRLSPGGIDTLLYRIRRRLAGSGLEMPAP
jgi:RNA polymerase sigma factor (sigma-70 family)